MAISMGCNVGRPFIGRGFDDNWGLEDPTGKSDEEFKIVISQIEEKIKELIRSIIKECWNDFMIRSRNYYHYAFVFFLEILVFFNWLKEKLNNVESLIGGI